MPNPVVIFEGTGGRATDHTLFGQVKKSIVNHADNVLHIDGVGANNRNYNPAQWHKTLWGRGWKNSANSAFEWLKGKLGDNPFMEVNLLGFSRGAVTAIALAWKLNKYLLNPSGTQVPVNIFAFDPIPGGQRDFQNAEDVVNAKGEDVTFNAYARNNLPPNVVRYYTVLFEGSKIKGPKCFWTPINPMGGKERKEIFLPGTHTGKNTKGTYYIIYSFIEEFCEKSKIIDNFEPFEGCVLVECYSEILHYAYFNNSAQSTFRNNIFVGRNRYRDHLFFVNNHHYDKFKEEFPKLADALNQFDSNVSIKPIDFNDIDCLDNIVTNEKHYHFTNLILFQNYLNFSPDYKNWAFCKYLSKADHAKGEALETYAFYRCDSLLVTPVHAAVKNAAISKLKLSYGNASLGRDDIPKMKDISEAEFKRVTKLSFLDQRKDQVKEVDNMLKLYENPERTKNQKERLIVAIALQVEEHLLTKPKSNRRNGVLALAAKILEKENVGGGRNSSDGNNLSSLSPNSSEDGELKRSSGTVVDNSIKNRNTGNFGN